MCRVHDSDGGRYDGDRLRPLVIGTLVLTRGLQTMLARFSKMGMQRYLDVSKYSGEDEQRLGIP